MAVNNFFYKKLARFCADLSHDYY